MERQTGLTYPDLRRFPEDGLRRELIGGELIVTAAPSGSHQDVVLELGSRLLAYAKEHGGKAYVAPRDVLLSEEDVVQPDVVFVGPDRIGAVEEAHVGGAPSLVVEVSSPSTRRLELLAKRDLYERYQIPEYWLVDLDAERIEVYQLEGKGYRPPSILVRGETFRSAALPGFSVQVSDLLPPAPG